MASKKQPDGVVVRLAPVLAPDNAHAFAVMYRGVELLQIQNVPGDQRWVGQLALLGPDPLVNQTAHGVLHEAAGLLRYAPAVHPSLTAPLSDRRVMQHDVANCLVGQHVRVTRSLAGGETLLLCGGITVIPTPGHTVGHVCLYLAQGRTLIAGDALNVHEGVLRSSVPAQSLDVQQARASLGRLAPFDVASVICYHGGLYRDAPTSGSRTSGTLAYRPTDGDRGPAPHVRKVSPQQRHVLSG